MRRRNFTPSSFRWASARPSAVRCSQRAISPAEKMAEEEADVGGALGEAAHEIGEPVLAERDVDADAIAVPDQASLQVGANAVEHLKLEVIFGDLLGRRMADGRRDHPRIVRGDAVIEAAG